MPAVPKRRHSKARRDRRRSHDALAKVAVVVDSESGEARRPHHLDLETGKYKGRQLMSPKK